MPPTEPGFVRFRDVPHEPPRLRGARACDRLLAAYEDLAAGVPSGTLPCRTALDPVLTWPDLLPTLFLFEVDESGDFIYRLAGSELQVSPGWARRGVPLERSGKPPMVIAETRRILGTVVTARRPVHVEHRITYPDRVIEAVSVAMPYANPGCDPQLPGVIFGGIFRTAPLPPVPPLKAEAVSITVIDAPAR